MKRITADLYLRNNKEATSEDRPADPKSDSVWESDLDDDDVSAVIGDSDTDEDSTVEPPQTTETETCQFSSGTQI